MTFSGPSSFTGTDELANSLASPGLFEERAVIGSPRCGARISEVRT